MPTKRASAPKVKAKKTTKKSVPSKGLMLFYLSTLKQMPNSKMAKNWVAKCKRNHGKNVLKGYGYNNVLKRS